MDDCWNVIDQYMGQSEAEVQDPGWKSQTQKGPHFEIMTRNLYFLFIYNPD